jgi:hypothetical protein
MEDAKSRDQPVANAVNAAEVSAEAQQGNTVGNAVNAAQQSPVVSISNEVSAAEVLGGGTGVSTQPPPDKQGKKTKERQRSSATFRKGGVQQNSRRVKCFKTRMEFMGYLAMYHKRKRISYNSKQYVRGARSWKWDRAPHPSEVPLKIFKEFVQNCLLPLIHEGDAWKTDGLKISSWRDATMTPEEIMSYVRYYQNKHHQGAVVGQRVNAVDPNKEEIKEEIERTLEALERSIPPGSRQQLRHDVEEIAGELKEEEEEEEEEEAVERRSAFASLGAGISRTGQAVQRHVKAAGVGAYTGVKRAGVAAGEAASNEEYAVGAGSTLALSAGLSILWAMSRF